MRHKDLLEFCAQAVLQVLKFDRPADALLSQLLREQGKSSRWGSRERYLVSETVYVVLRKKLLFEAFCLSAPKVAGPRNRRMALLGFPGAASSLKDVLDPAEIAWLNACHAVDPYADGTGLMDRHRHNLPDWLAGVLREQLGEDFWPLVRSLEQQAALDLRVNLLTDRPQAVAMELQAAGIQCAPTPHSPWGLRIQGKPALHRLPVFERGAVEVQDEGSQLLALLLDAKRGEMVVDFCAGAGGKTLALGASMRNTGRLYAFDASAHRLEALKPRLARSGLSNVYPVAIAHERDDRVRRLHGKIDRVLVDAPCSGLGTLRRHPDLKWRQNEASVALCIKQQKDIIEAAAALLKPGGRLIYATCSLLRSENEELALDFSMRHPDFLPQDVAEVLVELKVESAHLLCEGPFLRLWPHRHGTDGFFAAIWRRSK